MCTKRREKGSGRESKRCGDDIVICRSKVPSYCYLPYLARGRRYAVVVQDLTYLTRRWLVLHGCVGPGGCGAKKVESQEGGEEYSNTLSEGGLGPVIQSHRTLVMVNHVDGTLAGRGRQKEDGMRAGIVHCRWLDSSSSSASTVCE